MSPMTLIRHFRTHSVLPNGAPRAAATGTRYRSPVFAPLVLGRPGPWEDWRKATCLPDDCFCEAIEDALVAQPANTWSSLAFVLAALWVAARFVRRGGSERAPLVSAEAALLVGSLALVGLGSAFYHASLTFIGQVLDVSGMYLVVTFILLHRLGLRYGVRPLASVAAFVLMNAALLAAQVTTPPLRRIVFGVLLVTALIVEWRSSRAGRRWLAAGAGLMAIAFAIWTADRLRVVCAPASPIQGHAIWHLLGAFASVCLYRSYEVETAAPEGTTA